MSRVAVTVVAPLAIRQRLEFTGHGVMRPTKMHQVPATLAAVWPNRSFLPSSVTAGCVENSALLLLLTGKFSA